MKLDVIISFRNEEHCLNELTSRINAAVKTSQRIIQYQIIFVNDNSTDNSLDILLSLKEFFPIKIVNMSRRFGNGPCLLAGFSISKSDLIIYLDADLQDPPELIPEMIDLFTQGYDVVHTKRTIRHGESWFKLQLTNIAYKLLGSFSKLDLPRNAGDFKLLSKRVVSHINTLNEVNAFLRFLPILIGFKQITLNYERDRRAQGETHFPIFSGAPYREFFRGLVSVTSKPLVVPMIFGILGSIFSSLMIMYSIIIKFFNQTSSGIPTVIILISIFSSAILLSLGFIGLYLAQVVDQTRNRPIFIIDEVI